MKNIASKNVRPSFSIVSLKSLVAARRSAKLSVLCSKLNDVAGKCNEICLENHGLEYDRKLKQKQLEIATKGLREMIIKQNTRDFRREQQDKAARRSKEYGKVLFEVIFNIS